MTSPNLKITIEEYSVKEALVHHGICVVLALVKNMSDYNVAVVSEEQNNAVANENSMVSQTR